MRHTEPDYYHSAPSLGCLLALSGVASLSGVGWALYQFGKLAWHLLQPHL